MIAQTQDDCVVLKLYPSHLHLLLKPCTADVTFQHLSLSLSLLFSMFVWLPRKSRKLKPKFKIEKDKPTNHLWAYGHSLLTHHHKNQSPPLLLHQQLCPLRSSSLSASPYGSNPSPSSLNPSSNLLTSSTHGWPRQPQHH